MKKTLYLLVCLAGLLGSLTSYAQTGIVLTGFMRVGTDSADVAFTNPPLTKTYYRIQVSVTPTFAVPFTGPLDSIETLTSDIQRIALPAGNVWYSRIISSDSSMSTVVDTSNIMLILYPLSIVSSNLTPTADGYIASTVIDPGNDTLYVRDRILYDALGTFYYEYRADTMFTSPGGMITVSDTVNALPNSFTAWMEVLAVQLHGGTSDTVITQFTTLPPASPPLWNLYGSRTHTSNSIKVPTTEDVYGVTGVATLRWREQGQSQWADSIVHGISAIVGAQIDTFATPTNLTPSTTYEFGGELRTVHGVAYLTMFTETTDPTPAVFNLFVQNIVLGSQVEITGGYTNPPGEQIHMTIGYSASGSAVLLQYQDFNNLTGSSTQTASLAYPASPGLYTAKVYGYNMTTFETDEDSLQFTVTTTSIAEYVNKNLLVDKYTLTAIDGRVIMVGKSAGTIPGISQLDVASGIYILSCFDKKGELLYRNKIFKRF